MRSIWDRIKKASPNIKRTAAFTAVAIVSGALGVVGKDLFTPLWKRITEPYRTYYIVVIGPSNTKSSGDESWTQVEYGAQTVLSPPDHKESETGDYRVQALYWDDLGDPRHAKLLAESIVQDDRILAVVGHGNSSITLECAQIYRKAGLPLIMPTATHPGLTRRPTEPDAESTHLTPVFRLPPDDDQQAVEASRQARVLLGEGGTVAILRDYENSDYSDYLARRFRNQLEEDKIDRPDIVIDGTVGYRSSGIFLNSEFGHLQPDLIFFPGESHTALTLIKQILHRVEDHPSDATWNPYLLLSDSSATSQFFQKVRRNWARVRDTFRGIYVTFPIPHSWPIHLALASEFEKPYLSVCESFEPEQQEAEPITYKVYGHDALQIAVTACLKAESPNRAQILKYLNQFVVKDPETSNGKNVFRGCLAAYQFGPDGERMDARFYTWRLNEEGFLEPVD